MWCVLFWFFVNDSSQYGLNWHKTNVFSTSHSIILGERCCVKCWMTELSIISSFWCKIIVKRGNNSFKNDTIKLQYKQNVNLPIVISDHSIYCSKFPLLKVWGFAYKLLVMEGRHRQEDKYHMCKGLSVMYSTYFHDSSQNICNGFCATSFILHSLNLQIFTYMYVPPTIFPLFWVQVHKLNVYSETLKTFYYKNMK